MPTSANAPLPTSSSAGSTRRAAQPFHVMTKPIGSVCNLDCQYCFYLEKARLYPDRPNFRMSADVLAAYIRDYIAAQPGNTVHFAWQGGEPTLLGVDYFREVVRLQQQFGDGRTIENAFQTNGVLLDDAWAAFFAEHRFLVGVSIDGPAEIHDAYRVDKGGQPTFQRVIAGIEVLKQHRVEFNTLTTVHRRSTAEPRRIYRFLRELGSRYLQFIPIVERAADATTPSGLWLAAPPESGEVERHVTPWSVRPADYGAFLCAVFDEWVRCDVGEVFVQQFDAALANWMGLRAGVCVFSETCGRALAVEHNGDVYSCDHYVYPRYKLGNLMNASLASLVDSPAQQAFGAAKSAALPRYCRECPVRFACHGECPKHRFLTTPDGEPGLNYLCAAYRKFFRHIDSPMRTMAALLQSGRPAAAIMYLPRADWLRAGL